MLDVNTIHLSLFRLLLTQHTQSCYFLVLPKSLVIIFQTRSFFISSWLAISRAINRRFPHCTRIGCSTLTSILLLSCSWSHLSSPRELLWTSCTPQKHECYLHILAEVFHVIVRRVLLLSPKFQVYSLLGVHSSFFNAHCWTTWKKGGGNKSMLELQWLQKAKITVIRYHLIW